MLTLQQLKDMPPKTVFASGEVENSPDGIYMTDSNVGSKLRWAARRGGIHDWAIYIHWAYHSLEYILNQGDKVTGVENIKKLVPCEQEALEMYRR